MKKLSLISLKIVMDRARMHLATINFIMIAYLVISESPYPFWVVLPIAIIGVFILGLIDYLVIFPKELNKTAMKNPVLMGIKRDINDIKNTLKSEVR